VAKVEPTAASPGRPKSSAKLLARRGVTTTAGALAALLGAHAVEAVPASLAATLAQSAFAATGGGGFAALLTAKLMSMTKLKIAAASLAIVAAGVPLAWQRQTALRLEEENRAWRQRLADSAGEPSGSSAVAKLVEVDQLERQRAEHVELLRLRDEATRLRREVGALKPNRAAIAAESGNAPDEATVLKQPADWRDVGFGSPAAALETMLWAQSRGQRDRFMQALAVPAGVDPGVLELWRRQFVPTPDWSDTRKGYYVTAVKPIVDGLVEVTEKVTMADGGTMLGRRVFQRMGDDWKALVWVAKIQNTGQPELSLTQFIHGGQFDARGVFHGEPVAPPDSQ